jgi:ubiquinone/menaquinone biosynthesis C-methylase UbiE
MEYYDVIASSYNELYKQEQLDKLSIIKFSLKGIFKIKKEHKLLDIGCGNGIGQGFFSINFGCEPFGIDTSKKLLEQNSYPNIYANAENILLPNKSFDIILSLTAIQNFDDVDKALNEMKRLCKEFLIITFLKKSHKANLIESKLKKKFKFVKKIEEKKDFILFLKV